MALDTVRGKSRREYWQNHIERSESGAGSMMAYCRAEGISLATLNYWRKKLKNEAPSLASLPEKAVARYSERLSSFIPLQIAAEKAPDFDSGLPDPRWLAEFILNLCRDRARTTGRGNR